MKMVEYLIFQYLTVILNCFSCCHVGDPIEARRKELSFVCDCIACLENWPTGSGLVAGPIPQPILTKDPVLLIDIFDRSIVEPNYKKIVDYLQNNDEHYPCKQLITMQNIYAHMIDLKYGKEIPLSVRFNPPHELFRL